MKLWNVLFPSVILVASVLLPAVEACESCSLYKASRLRGQQGDSWTLSLSNQYTEYSRTEAAPENSIRDGDLDQSYSTTDFVLGYDFSDRFGLQFGVPLIRRTFEEISHYRSDDQSDVGIGDMVLAGNYSLVRYQKSAWWFMLTAVGGVKFPTGDTGSLGRFSDAESSQMSQGMAPIHHSIGASEGGQTLVMGSGSYDFITGLDLLVRFERYLLLSNVQYTIRTEGDFDYEFADSIMWSFGPGYYIHLSDEESFALRVAISGDSKGKDHHQGQVVAASQSSTLYVGPELLFTIGSSVSGDVSIQGEVYTADTDEVTVAPDFRVRAGISYRFD